MTKTKFLSYLFTAIIVVIALVLGRLLWVHYLDAPWTRAGRIRADVVQIAPDVSGLVTAVPIHDNELVRKGQVLLVIDPARFNLALQQAEANLAGAMANARAAGAAIQVASANIASQASQFAMLEAEAARRSNPATAKFLSAETRQNAVDTARSGKAALNAARASHGQASASAQQAAAAVQQAEVEVAVAKLNLERSEVRAPTDGYVTNLGVRVGDYADTGAAQLALVDSHSFYIYGYFEETKLPRIQPGDPVDIRLMAGGVHLKGVVTGIARGISDSSNPRASDMLLDTNPVFDWVRLAQRVPVRVKIDPASVPKGLVLAAGMTATLAVQPRRHP